MLRRLLWREGDSGEADVAAEAATGGWAADGLRVLSPGTVLDLTATDSKGNTARDSLGITQTFLRRSVLDARLPSFHTIADDFVPNSYLNLRGNRAFPSLSTALPTLS